MLRYALKRLLLAVAIVAATATALFCMIYMVPGDPASIALGPRATPEMRAELEQRMGLDQPLPIQLIAFFGNILTGDFGRDVWSNRPVLEIVLEDLPHTLILLAAGLFWPLLIGVPLGCYAAVYRHSLADRLVGFVSVGVIALPSFVVAIYALILFSVTLGWFPAVGVGEPGNLLDYLHHLVLPAFAVGLGWLGYLSRVVRASMLDVLGEHHIRTARAYGLAEWRITYIYALKIAIQPTIALIGVGIGTLLAGAVFAEIVFARPGIGKLIYNSVLSRNYPVVMGATIITTSLIALATLVVDLINASLDPRIREHL